MPSPTAPDGSTACICGGRWVIVAKIEWGAKARCVNDHTKDFLDNPGKKINAIRSVGGRSGSSPEPVPVAEPSLWLTLRVAFWRGGPRGALRALRQEITSSLSAAGRYMSKPLDD